MLGMNDDKGIDYNDDVVSGLSHASICLFDRSFIHSALTQNPLITKVIKVKIFAKG